MKMFIAAPSTGPLLDRMLRDNCRVDALQLARTAPLSRPCVMCDRTAWIESVDAEGSQSYLCSHGHQTVITPARAI